MLKKIIINIVIGGAIFLFGALFHDLTEMEDVGRFIIVSGIAYGWGDENLFVQNGSVFILLNIPELLATSRIERNI